MNTQKVVDAVNHLIYAPNYAALSSEITRIIERWDTHPHMVYGGQLSCLNALIDVGIQSRAAYDNLIAMVEERRKLVPRVRRVDYQRDLMQQRRAREAKAIELHELNYGPIRGAGRLTFLQGLRDRWARERASFIRRKGDLTWKERNAAAGEFWAMIDRKLEINIEDARRKRA